MYFPARILTLICLIIYLVIYFFYIIPAILDLYRRSNLWRQLRWQPGPILILLWVLLATLVLFALIYAIWLNSWAGVVIFVVALLFVWYISAHRLIEDYMTQPRE